MIGPISLLLAPLANPDTMLLADLKLTLLTRIPIS